MPWLSLDLGTPHTGAPPVEEALRPAARSQGSQIHLNSTANGRRTVEKANNCERCEASSGYLR